MKTIFIVLLFTLPATAFAQNSKLKPGLVTMITINQEKWNQLNNDYTKLQNELKDIKNQNENIQALLRELESHNQRMKIFTADLQTWEKQVDAASVTNQSQLLQATNKMQETQMSFNLQYLQLQSQMQNENRQFTTITNIMKTKHDTVKNSISNIK